MLSRTCGMVVWYVHELAPRSWRNNAGAFWNGGLMEW